MNSAAPAPRWPAPSGGGPSEADLAAAAALGVEPDAMVLDVARGGSRSVSHSAELDRVLALPRRDWWRGMGGRFGSADEVRELLSRHLRLPGSTERLKLVQSAALQECHDLRGVVAPIVVGGGKTLLSLLLAVVMAECRSGAPCARPLLLVPTKLLKKTTRERDRYAADWRVPELALAAADWRPGMLLVVTYEALSRAEGSELLERFDPDLVVADEAHRLRHTTSARTRRLSRFLERRAREGRRAIFVPMTGTMTKRSVRDYAHLLRWSLHEGAPLPRRPELLAEWAAAMDERQSERLSVGALARLCGPDEQEALLANPLLAVRRAYGRRLVQTPGVVAVEDDYQIAAKLRVRALHLAPDEAQARALRKLREEWETPGGEPFAAAVDAWRHAREVACGFYYRWKYPAPDEWLEARRAWCRFVREVLRNRRAKDAAGEPLDAERQVALACANGRLPRQEYDAWRAVRDTFRPRTEAVWISDAPLAAAARWLAEHERGICWVEHRCVGRRLEELHGFPYFAQKGMDRRRRYVEDERGPLVASIRANCEGRNLQYWHRDNLILSLPPSGDECEQLLGRTHRDGQEAEVVSAEVLLSCSEMLEGWYKALADAEYLQTTTRSAQKLLSADVSVGPPSEVPPGW